MYMISWASDSIGVAYCISKVAMQFNENHITLSYILNSVCGMANVI